MVGKNNGNLTPYKTRLQKFGKKAKNRLQFVQITKKPPTTADAPRQTADFGNIW